MMSEEHCRRTMRRSVLRNSQVTKSGADTFRTLTPFIISSIRSISVSSPCSILQVCPMTFDASYPNKSHQLCYMKNFKERMTRV